MPEASVLLNERLPKKRCQYVVINVYVEKHVTPIRGFLEVQYEMYNKQPEPPLKSGGGS